MSFLSTIFGFFRIFQIWVTIAPWETGLRVRLGKTATVLPPGPHLRIPFLDRIFVQATRVRTIADDGQTLTTKDGKILAIAVCVSYAIFDIKKLYLSVENPETTLLNQIQGLIADYVSSTDAATLTSKHVEKEITSKMPSTEWGLSSASILVTTFAFIRTYKIVNSHMYRSLSSADNLEQKNPGV